MSYPESTIRIRCLVAFFEYSKDLARLIVELENKLDEDIQRYWKQVTESKGFPSV